MVDQATSEHVGEVLEVLGETGHGSVIDAGSALPDGEPWVKVSGVALELTRLARQFGAACHEQESDAS